MKQKTNRAFSLIELLIALAALAILTAVAVPSYKNYVDRLDLKTSKTDILKISVKISDYFYKQGSYPISLADINMDHFVDPWGNPYLYLDVTIPANEGDARKDRFLHPVNTDYDLYSIGKDGLTRRSLNHSDSEDDVLRANSGGFLGYAEDY